MEMKPSLRIVIQPSPLPGRVKHVCDGRGLLRTRARLSRRSAAPTGARRQASIYYVRALLCCLLDRSLRSTHIPVRSRGRRYPHRPTGASKPLGLLLGQSGPKVAEQDSCARVTAALVESEAILIVGSVGSKAVLFNLMERQEPTPAKRLVALGPSAAQAKMSLLRPPDLIAVWITSRRSVVRQL